MYNTSSQTSQTIHNPATMATMIDELDTPVGAPSYYTFNGNTEALAQFTTECEMYDQTAGGRVTRLSAIEECMNEYDVAIPACVPASCGMDDTMIAIALSDIFENNNYPTVYLSSDESITSTCLLDVVNSTYSPRIVT